jgi:hypothetical protein
MARRGFASEVDLYPPVKRFFERQGFAVKGEVNGCDLVALRGREPPVVVELKLAFTLGLVLQGVSRQQLTDRVYLAVPPPKARGARHSPWDKDVRKLCRMLGLGLIVIGRGGGIEVALEPGPYRPRKVKWRLEALVREHSRRAGDPNRGGSTRVKIVTAYRQEALRCALLLKQNGAMRPRDMRKAADVPNAAKILQKDYYGWFTRLERGLYGLTEAGLKGLEAFVDALPATTAPLAAD